MFISLFPYKCFVFVWRIQILVSLASEYVNASFFLSGGYECFVFFHLVLAKASFLCLAHINECFFLWYIMLIKISLVSILRCIYRGLYAGLILWVALYETWCLCVVHMYIYFFSYNTWDLGSLFGTYIYLFHCLILYDTSVLCMLISLSRHRFFVWCI